MANNPSTLPGYNGQTAAPTGAYPYGSARNDSSPGDLTGTPRIAEEINDILGFQQALLQEAGIVPSGIPDTVLESQYLEAIKKIPSTLSSAQTFVFTSVASYKSFDVEFPVGKIIKLLDRGAEFEVIAGVGSADTFAIIASDEVDQSIKLIPGGVVDAKAFGAVGDGATLDQPVFDFIPGWQSNNNNTSVQISDGEYLIDGIQIDHDEAQFLFVGEVTLKANSNDKVLFNQSGSFAKHQGTFRTNSNGKTGVIGMMCAPEDRNQTTTLVQTNHNQMPGIRGDSQLELVIGLQCGPDVGGTDSGCFYNIFPFARGRGAVGGIRLFPGPNASSSSPNRNTFRDCRFGTEGGVSPNFGLWIESGDTNKFFGCDFEGIGSGVERTSPLANATAVRIEQTDINGIDNNFNTFFGGQCEANLIDLVILNDRTFLYGVGYADSKSTLPTSNIFKTIPARDSSGAATRLLGTKTLDDNSMIVTSTAIGDDNGGGGFYNWSSYPLSTTNVSQGGVDITAIAQNSSYYRQLFGMISWHFRLAFTAVSTTNTVKIPLPLEAQNNLYVAPGSAQTMKFPCRITNGTTEEAGVAKINGTDLEIETHSGNWNTGGNVNAIWVQIDYHAV